MNAVRVCALLMTLLLSACVSGPTMDEVKPSIKPLKEGQGRVYFYREPAMLGYRFQPGILLNGQAVGESQPGGFFFVDQAPGTKEVASSIDPEKKLTFTLQAGETRYVRTFGDIEWFKYHVYSELVDNFNGRLAVEKLAYIGPSLK